MSQVVYGVPHPFLSAQGVYLEPQEEEKQANGGLELVRIPPSLVSQPLEELVTASVENVVGSHPRVGARQGHGHAVYALVSDENEERCGVIASSNRNVQLGMESSSLPFPFVFTELG